MKKIKYLLLLLFCIPALAQEDNSTLETIKYKTSLTINSDDSDSVCQKIKNIFSGFNCEVNFKEPYLLQTDNEVIKIKVKSKKIIVEYKSNGKSDEIKKQYEKLTDRF
ncbi:hypothetical protein ABS768_17165 [Flavobacterium sp. ST-75]|uniref:Uncharacterized protein n=1 Tax=Flavobacterium rhizophilum TaxID=3163296 RepID=A0ABW8YIZ0_9FLAO